MLVAEQASPSNSDPSEFCALVGVSACSSDTSEEYEDALPSVDKATAVEEQFDNGNVVQGLSKLATKILIIVALITAASFRYDLMQRESDGIVVDQIEVISSSSFSPVEPTTTEAAASEIATAPQEQEQQHDSELVPPQEQQPVQLIQQQNFTFEDIEFLKFLGGGSGKVGFAVKLKGIHNKIFAAKVVGSRKDVLRKMNREVKMFNILNAPPSIPNIPEIKFFIPSMKNPFTKRYLTKTLGVKEKYTNRLLGETISILVMEYLDFEHSHLPPVTVAHFRPYLRSLLQTLEFAHSRNVMNCDLQTSNVFYDRAMVKLFDWDRSAIFEPNSVRLRTTKDKLPPEGWHNKKAVHASVSAYDIWDLGLTLQHLMGHPEVIAAMDEEVDIESEMLLEDFINATLTRDPLLRPNATQLLQHPFLIED